MDNQTFKGSSLQVTVVSLEDNPHPSRDQHFSQSETFRMIKTRGNRALLGSPRMSRSKVLPISTAQARRSLVPRSDLKTDPASYLEVTALISAEPRRQQRFENTYKLAPDQPFVAHEITKVTEAILMENLHDKVYDASNCKTLSQLISSRIVEELKRTGYSKYKMVAIVSIGSMKERPGVQLGSRCLWNKETDNFISAKYSNRSLFAVAMVYGLYYE